MASPKLTVECTDMDAFQYSLKDLPTILKKRFADAGGDVKSAKYVQTSNSRWAMVGEYNPCYDLSDMD